MLGYRGNHHFCEPSSTGMPGRRMLGAPAITQPRNALRPLKNKPASFDLTCRPPTSCWTTWFISCSGASHLLIHALTASADILMLSLHLAMHRYAALEGNDFTMMLVAGVRACRLSWETLHAGVGKDYCTCVDYCCTCDAQHFCCSTDPPGKTTTTPGV